MSTQIPFFAKAWLFLSAVIVIFDASYVLFKLADSPYFQAYQIYASVDKAYSKELYDGSFTRAQSWLNLVEAAIVFIGLATVRSLCDFMTLSAVLKQEACGYNSVFLCNRNDDEDCLILRQ
jgi:hypothetical protein